MTLEWLLIVGAVAALAAVTAWVVQRVVDDEVNVDEDPAVLALDAEIAAAFIVEETYQAALREAAANPLFDPAAPAFWEPFKARCDELATAGRFGAVLSDATVPPLDTALASPFRCELTFRDLASL